jgi:hypothetical protein
VIEAGDSELLRVAAEPYKKLQDEVRPALIYATNELPSQAEIQFHLSDRGPDATAWPDAHSAPLLIEVTVASGKVRHAQMKAPNETGVGHGFTDATDADTPEQIKARYDDCGAHSPDEVCANLGAAIRLCVERKAEEKHRGRTLVILATQNRFSPRNGIGVCPRLDARCRRHPAKRSLLSATLSGPATCVIN